MNFDLDAIFHRVYLLLNGTLVLDSNGKKVYYEPDTFCLDGSLTTTFAEDETGTDEYPDQYQVVYYSGQELDQMVILCYNPADEVNGQQPEVSFTYLQYFTLEVIDELN